jgi:hypothetical protein
MHLNRRNDRNSLKQRLRRKKDQTLQKITVMTESNKNLSTDESVEAVNSLSRRRFLGRASGAAVATAGLASGGFLLGSSQKAVAQQAASPTLIARASALDR